MIEKTVTVFVANDGTTFNNKVECISYERYLKDKQCLINEMNTHLYEITSDGYSSLSYDEVGADMIVFDTFEAYKQYIQNLDKRIGQDEFADEVYANSQFPAVFRDDRECCCYKNWREEREQLEKTLAMYDQVIKGECIF